MPQKSPTTARLEAFSDGVIAVIITIMVLELKVPHQDGAAGLYAVVPILLIYLLSFAFTGIYWINHQHLIKRIELADAFTLYMNLFFLFCLSLLPFFTSYLLEKKMDSFAVFLYDVSMIVTGFSFLLLRLAVHRNLKYFGDLQKEDTRARAKHLASLCLYLLAAPLAYFHAQLSLGIIALVTVAWIVPNLTLKRMVCDGD
jgi:TMEM175 potassium channel family protein